MKLSFPRAFYRATFWPKSAIAVSEDIKFSWKVVVLLRILEESRKVGEQSPGLFAKHLDSRLPPEHLLL